LLSAEVKLSATALSGLALRREDFPLSAFFLRILREGRASTCGLDLGPNAYLSGVELEDDVKSTTTVALDFDFGREGLLLFERVLGRARGGKVRFAGMMYSMYYCL
jgi:hypothetical protein